MSDFVDEIMQNMIVKNMSVIYEEDGLMGVYRYLKSKKIKFIKKIVEFGLHTNKNTQIYKDLWLKDYKPNVFKRKYSNNQIKSRKTGYSYNIIRGIEIEIFV